MNRTLGLWGWSRWLKGWFALPLWGADVGALSALAHTWKATGKAPMLREVVKRDDALKQDERPVKWRDFGAGCPPGGSPRVSEVRQLAGSASSDQRKGRWLMSVVHTVAAQTGRDVRILELGTCLGSGSDYLASGAPAGGTYHGLEGSKVLTDFTLNRLERHRARGVHVAVDVGPFSHTLPVLVGAANRFDVVFLDGCHEGAALLEQWRDIQPLLAEGGMVIVDDIRWSRDMFQAWKTLTSSEGFTGIDLFRMGVVTASDAVGNPKGNLRVSWRQRA